MSFMCQCTCPHVTYHWGFVFQSQMQRTVKSTSFPIIFLALELCSHSSTSEATARPWSLATGGTQEVDYLDKPSVASAERLPKGRKKGRKNCLSRARNAHLPNESASAHQASDPCLAASGPASPPRAQSETLRSLGVKEYRRWRR